MRATPSRLPSWTGCPDHWDGRKAVTWLAHRGLRGSNDNEWQGFYGEERAKIALAAALTPNETQPRVRYGNTTFDYALNWVWDIKVHTEIQVFDDRVLPPRTRRSSTTSKRSAIVSKSRGLASSSSAAPPRWTNPACSSRGTGRTNRLRGRVCALELGPEPHPKGSLRPAACRGVLATGHGCAARGNRGGETAHEAARPTGAQEPRRTGRGSSIQVRDANAPGSRRNPRGPL